MLINGDNSSDLSTDVSLDEQSDNYFSDNMEEPPDLLTSLAQDLDIPSLLNPELLGDPYSANQLQTWDLDNLLSGFITQDSNIKQEYKEEPSSPLRSTPSPNQQINLENYNKNDMLINNHLDTPPISPQEMRFGSTINYQNEAIMQPVVIAQNPVQFILQDNVQIVSTNIAKRPLLQPKPLDDVMQQQIYETRPGSSLLNTDKELDKRALKKHQRMIKNRESACLSRKKKKEYLSSLEVKVAELSEENKALKQENAKLKSRLATYESPCTMSMISLSPKARKNATFLLAVLVMFSFNFGFSNIFRQNPDIELNTQLNVPIGRRLLWVGNQNMDYDDLNQETNDTSKYNSMCPMFINISESKRLESELRKWIGIKQAQLFNNNSSLNNIQNVTTELIEKKNRLYKKSKGKTKLRRRKVIMEKIGYGELDVFEPKQYRPDYEFYEAINRRDDTFYVVSFNLDHLLLPALSHNSSSRPKMSLLMPVLGKNNSFGETVQLMQIDCEVTNTSLVKLEYNQIPRHLRPNKYNAKYDDSNYNSNAKFNINGTVAEKMKGKAKGSYKPYFIRNDLIANVTDTF